MAIQASTVNLWLKTSLVGFLMLPIILCFNITGVFADELFIEVSYSQGKENQDSTIIRSRYVQVNFDYLMEAEVIDLNLLDDVSFIAVKEHVEMRSENQYSWFGSIEGAEHGQVILVVEHGDMAGNITTKESIFQIRPKGNGVHAIYEINQNAFPEEAPPIPVDTPEDLAPTLSQPDDGSIIDVMVVYTDDVANASVNISAEIQLAIAETNASYSNSGIHQRLRLVHTAEVIYPETGDMNADLYCITSKRDGCLDNMHSLRDIHNADAVSFWVEDGGGYCGLAWMMVMVTPFFESFAFSVVDRECATGNYTFGHELGHNMGAHHDRYVTTGDGADPFSHGYVYTPDRWRTIMAYNAECRDQGFNCTRIQHWSNPDISYNGVPTGVPAGQSDSADNRLTLNNTAYTVANFRPDDWQTAYQILFDNPSDLKALRKYRDEILTDTTIGVIYKTLFYKFSEKALKVLLTNPELMMQAKRLIDTKTFVVLDVLDGYEGIIYNTDEIVAFLDKYAKKSPPILKILAYVIKWDMLQKQRQGKLFHGFRLK
jgi:hypothetical protein